MKFYSETTKQLYDTEAALVKAEEAVAAKEAEKKAQNAEKAKAAKEIENAYKVVIEAQKHYDELKNAFIDKYGSFHMTYTEKKPVVSTSNQSASDIFDILFNLF